ncbi:cilia- and flagella-associated protein 54 [Gracilinanus agilis]|uniref:cilia- and flagella-associated protein 54 n=1 Tax=Gracilinanus agilis TaxID=191870 RepID=UPI001CFCE814|nr:cilia- and flagella-associated protein 54 [Gracilinanus agilis]
MDTLKVPGFVSPSGSASGSGSSGTSVSDYWSQSSEGADSTKAVSLKVPTSRPFLTKHPKSGGPFRGLGQSTTSPTAISRLRRDPFLESLSMMKVMRQMPIKALRKFPVMDRKDSECQCPIKQRPRPCNLIEQPGANFYGPLDAKNPLLISFQKELQGVLDFLKRKQSQTHTPEEYQEYQQRGTFTLFNIWFKYQNRLPPQYYHEHLLKTGDGLSQTKEYKLALIQCYGKYLSQFNPSLDESEMNVLIFKKVFFSKGVNDESAKLTFHALQGKCISQYQIICASDPCFKNEQSAEQCFKILSVFRLMMQIALPYERLCWIVYNGSIHIYTICRKLMTIGQSAKALEFLLWASICMESSIPLLAVSYLTWRATLYTAVCQCYYDCHAGMQGEIFARRGLGKIDDLLHLQVMSITPPQEEERKKFREATIKMAVMIFKRAVFEPRRKNKSYVRTKLRLNLREAQNLQWPRTTTEKLLTEMFDCGSAQFLAILEALSEPNRKVLQTGHISEEIEVREVIAELFMAAGELLSDVCTGHSPCGKPSFSKNIFLNFSQMKLSIDGKQGVSIAAAVRLIKLAFTFEEWHLFNAAVPHFIGFLQVQSDPDLQKAKMDLMLLAAMEPLINVKRNKGLNYAGEGGSGTTEGPRTSGKKIVFQETFALAGSYSDDIFHLASMLFSFICSSTEKIRPDEEIVVDLIMFLWQKCKMGIQRIYSARMDYFKFVQKVKTNKWMQLLWQINEMISTCQPEDLNPVFVAEVALRLSEILEILGKPEKKSLGSTSRTTVEFQQVPDIFPLFKKTPEEQLLLAHETLEKAINVMGLYRTKTTLPNGKSVYDHCHIKVMPPTEGGSTGKPITDNSFMMDLHLELLLTQHRIAVTLIDQLKAWNSSPKSDHPKEEETTTTSHFTESYILGKINKNELSKSVFLMMKAQQLFEKDDSQVNKLLEESLFLIRKIESEQKNQYSQEKSTEAEHPQRKVPSPPILLSRTHCSVTFKPAPFSCGEQVAWYTILGRRAEKCMKKVRLSDHTLLNCGEPVPANDKTILEVVGLEPNEKYIFALAGYCSAGTLVGQGIGETSKPVLIYMPLSTITMRLHMTEIAFQLGKYSLAKKAFAPVWDYFVAPPPPENPYIFSLSSMLTVTPFRLHLETLSESSSILLYYFIRCIFVISNINIIEKKLYCDTIRGDEVFTCQQVFRLLECQRILVVIELSTYVNNFSYSLQAVVHCYGLLAPLIFHNIVLVPIIQILIKCLVILQEIPGVTFPKRQMGNFESTQHMIACSVYYTAKVLRSWKELDLAVIIINLGKKLLDTSQGLFSNVTKAAFSDDDQDDLSEETYSTKKVKRVKGQIAILDKISEQLNIMETQLLKLTKQSPMYELSGTEDPFFLYPIILTWSLKTAMREVMKFKSKPRFLEFFVQVMTKCLTEEKFHYVVELAFSVQSFLKRRNGTLLGAKRSPVLQNLPATEEPKKYKAAAMEIQKTTDLTLGKTKSKKKGALQEYFSKHLSLSELPDLEKFKRADVRKVALKILSELMAPKLSRYIKRKRLHRLFIEELPWRSQMNVHLAEAHFNLFRIRLMERKKVKACTSQNTMSFRILDPEIFSLYNSGTLLVDENLNPENYKALLDFMHSRKMRKTNLSEATEIPYGGGVRVSEDPPKLINANDQDPTKEKTAHFGIVDHFIRTFVHCKRALVLAHRGGYWTLLQNVTRALWNYTMEMQVLYKQAHSLSKTFPFSKDIMICTFVLPFSLAADALIDMLIDLQNSKSLKIVDDCKDFGVPSAFGNITEDNGGFNLTFEEPFDDMNLVDLKFISDFIFKTLEILYRVGKWETLIYIALQFNEVTHERYTEQVMPLLIYSQRQLLQKLQKNSVQQTNDAEWQFEDNVNLRDIIGKLPHPSFLKTVKDKSKGFINYEQGAVHSEVYIASRIVSVPLNVKETLKIFRETLTKSKYHSRSLRYSRKLLSLLLAHTQETRGGINNPKFMYGKVEFSLGTDEIYLPTPPDLFNEKFSASVTVQSTKLSPFQFQLVITSYEKTIDILEISNQTDLKIQALHELGNLHIYAENRRAAFKCWSQALDAILKKKDVLHTWKEIVSSTQKPLDALVGSNYIDYSEDFLSKAGIWGCLQGGVITAKMAQYILTSNMNERIECCIFSSFFFKALLRTSLVHPKHDHEYAHYEITQLTPGLDLFSDRYRADVSVVLSSLSYLCYELHSVHHDLIILPLISLNHYFVCEVCQDIFKTIDTRILKTEILIDLGFLSEAYNEMVSLYTGKNIPTSLPLGYKIPKIKHMQPFEPGRSCLSKENVQALEDLMNQGIPFYIILICQPAFSYKFTLVKMRFLISLAATINCFPDNDTKAFFQDFPPKGKLNASFHKVTHSCPEDFTTISQETVQFDLNTAEGTQRPLDKGTDYQKQRAYEAMRKMLMVDPEYLKDETPANVNLTKAKEELSPGKLKGILLSEAEEKLLMLIENAESLSHKKITQFSPVDLEIMLEVKLQLAAIAMQRQQAPLSTSIAFTTIKILQDAEIFKKTKEELGVNDDELDAMESTDMLARDRLNIHLWLKCRLALVVASVAHIRGMGVVKENEVTECRFLINEVFVEAQNWNDTEMQAEVMVQAIKLDLQERYSAANIIEHLKDIRGLLEGKSFVSPRGSLILMKSLLLMDDLMKIEMPQEYLFLKNENLNLLNQAHTLIIGQALSLGEHILLPSSDTEYANIIYPLKNIYFPYINLLAKTKMRIGHMLAKSIATCKTKEPSKWEPVRHLFEMALYLCRAAAKKECELEAEILFEKGKVERQMVVVEDKKPLKGDLLEAIKISLKNDENSGLIRKAYLELALLYLLVWKYKKNVSKVKILPQVQSTSKESLEEKAEIFFAMSWIAIRAASQVSEATIAAKKLTGEKSVKTEKMDMHAYQNIPDFARADITCTYVDYLTANYKTCAKTSYTTPSDSGSYLSMEQDLYTNPSEENEEPCQMEIMWVHLARYYTHLLRVNNMNTLLAPQKPIFLTDEIFYTSIFNEDLIIRQKEMKRFLKKFLSVFISACLEPFPKDLILGIEKPTVPDNSELRQSLKTFHDVNAIIEKIVITKINPIILPPTPPEVQMDFAINAESTDLCFQWYLPPLEKPPTDKEPMVMLLYAYNTKPVNINDIHEFIISSIFPGFLWLPLNNYRMTEVEMLFKTPSCPDEYSLTVFYQSCTEIARLLSRNEDITLISEVPFEESLPTIQKLEMLFDPANGSILKTEAIFNWITSFLPSI